MRDVEKTKREEQRNTQQCEGEPKLPEKDRSKNDHKEDGERLPVDMPQMPPFRIADVWQFQSAILESYHSDFPKLPLYVPPLGLFWYAS